MALLDSAAFKYIEACQPELRELIRSLCKIPAPSHKEDRRAEFCKKRLTDAGFENVIIDPAKNVIAPLIADETGKYTVYMAHMDTVFPEETELPQRLEGDIFHAPGAGDDTANLAVLLLCAEYMRKLSPKENLLFVCNSCEEGMGNLKGSRRLMVDYAGRIKEVISLDGYIESACNHPVGSHRYSVRVKTVGGHSFANFGNPNAIHEISRLVTELYGVPVPSGGRTTYNVGHISGGTSVNSIAEYAEILYEYRSDRSEHIAHMKGEFERIISAYKRRGVDITVDLIGERPGKGEMDAEGQRSLEARFSKSYITVVGHSPDMRSGSTDCNIPFSLGIPALCFGAVHGGGAHTYDEWIDFTSLRQGMSLALSVMLDAI